MEFGVNDNFDRNNLPLAEFYETRLQLTEAYDRAGFCSYHIAEHHSTPFSMAPSPSLFFSAVAQRTKKLRFGPLVYVLPLYHPLRMIEEICMLDQMSRGRLELGFGRGSVAMEQVFYGFDPRKAADVYAEALEIVIAGLTGKVVDFRGEHFRFERVPMELETFQKPHPPIWYGVHSIESAERAARRGLNVVCNEPAEASRAYLDRFRAICADARPGMALPRMGVTQFVLVGDSDEAAMEAARRAYRVWHRSFHHLWTLAGRTAPISGGEDHFDAVCASGKGVAGTPDKVAAFLRDRLVTTGANYCVVRLAFGDLTVAETLRSVDLFSNFVKPALADLTGD